MSDSNLIDWNMYDVDDGGRLYEVPYTQCRECGADFGEVRERGTLCDECEATNKADALNLVREIVRPQ